MGSRPYGRPSRSRIDCHCCPDRDSPQRISTRLRISRLPKTKQGRPQCQDHAAHHQCRDHDLEVPSQDGRRETPRLCPSRTEAPRDHFVALRPRSINDAGRSMPSKSRDHPRLPTIRDNCQLGGKELAEAETRYGVAVTLSVQPTSTPRAEPCVRSVPSWAFIGAQSASSSRGPASPCVAALPLIPPPHSRSSANTNEGADDCEECSSDPAALAECRQPMRSRYVIKRLGHSGPFTNVSGPALERILCLDSPFVSRGCQRSQNARALGAQNFFVTARWYG